MGWDGMGWMRRVFSMEGFLLRHLVPFRILCRFGSSAEIVTCATRVDLVAVWDGIFFFFILCFS